MGTWGTRAALAALLACGCGGSEFTAGVGQGGDAGDASSAQQDAPGDDGAASSTDGASDGAAHDATSADDGAAHDAAAVEVGAKDAHDDETSACTPLAFPLPPPSGYEVIGGPLSSPGSVWLCVNEGQPYCTPRALQGSAACEDCDEHYNCACLDALFVDAGAPWTGGTCVDGSAGPYWSE